MNKKETQSEVTLSDDCETNELMTGAEYLNSLNDGREVWYDGKRVENVAEHPAFRNAACNIARLYDTLHDPDLKDRLTKTDRFGIRTHKFFAPCYSAQDLSESREAIEVWQRMNYGWMGRTMDYKAAFMAQLGAGRDFYSPYDENALNWYKRTATKCLFINHVLMDPPVDRSKARINVRDVYLTMDKEDDKGIYVSGAKMVATGSALTHVTFVGMNSGTAARMEVGRDEDMALVFLVDTNASGLKLVSRPSYEASAKSPFDAPLSSRFDENDAVMVFENTFVPWENVLIYRNVEKCRQFYASSGFFNRYILQSATRLATKLGFCVGLLLKGTEATGTRGFRGVDAAIGELIAIRELIWSMTTALISDPETGIGGTVVPRLQTAAAARLYMTNAWHRVREIFETVLAGAPIYTLSSVRDMHVPELEPVIDRYYRGTGLKGPKRIKLFKLIWDALYSEFAGRHGLYERNYAGNQDQQRIDALQWADARGDVGHFKSLVDDCLHDYDIHGWTDKYHNNRKG